MNIFGSIADYLIPDLSLFAWILIGWIIFLVLDQLIFYGRIANAFALLFKLDGLQFKVLSTTILVLLVYAWNTIATFLGSTGGIILFWGVILILIVALLLFGGKKK